MQSAIAIRELNNLLANLEQLPTDWRSAVVIEWRSKLDAVVEASFGADSTLWQELQYVRFSPQTGVPDPGEQAVIDRRDFENARKQFIGKIKGAVYKLELEVTVAPEAGDFDAELWTHIDHSVDQQRWSEIPSQVAIYIEDRLRTLAGLDSSVFGVDLMTKCFHPKSGVFRLGETDGEKDGWHQFARGFSLAVSNAARHRLTNRDDARLYAMGVVGSASLLLTELFSTHESKN